MFQTKRSSQILPYITVKLKLYFCCPPVKNELKVQTKRHLNNNFCQVRNKNVSSVMCESYNRIAHLQDKYCSHYRPLPTWCKPPWCFGCKMCTVISIRQLSTSAFRLIKIVSNCIQWLTHFLDKRAKSEFYPCYLPGEISWFARG